MQSKYSLALPRYVTMPRERSQATSCGMISTSLRLRLFRTQLCTDMSTCPFWPRTRKVSIFDHAVTITGSSVSYHTGYVRTYLVLPSIAWGIATGPLFSAGISHHSTIILPILVKQSLERGRVVQFGEGLNKWAGIEIHEREFKALEVPYFAGTASLTIS